IPADGQLRDPFQLHWLSLAGRALPPEPSGSGVVFSGLPVGHLQLGENRLAGRQTRPSPSALGGYRVDAGRHGPDDVRAI
nr:hypothetical protein [Tanacetum cinerariifolium]